MRRKDIQTAIYEKYIEFGKTIGLNMVVVEEDPCLTSFYLISKHALQLEIDWQENVAFLYVVQLIDKKIPPSDIIYQYKDGKWCRRYIEEVYGTRNPMYTSQSRYRREFLLEMLDYYIALISENPEILLRYLH